MNVAEPLVQASLIGEAIDQGPVLVLVADDDMKYVAVNQFAADTLGYSREELLSLSVTDVVPGPDTERIFADFVAQRQLDGVTELTAKDGSVMRIGYRARETRVAGMQLYVSVGWLLD